MHLAFPLAFAQELDARAVHQQLQRRLGSLVAQFDLQGLLASADRAEIRHRPVQLGQLQQAFFAPCPSPAARAGRTGT